MSEIIEKAYEESCSVVGFQEAIICVPVTVKPFAKVKKVKTFCCGKPEIKPGEFKCCGEPKNECKFTISQKVCVAVPVEFGANTVVKEAEIKCLGAVCEEKKYGDCRETQDYKND